MLGDFFGNGIFSIFIVPVFKVFGYRMDGRDKPITEFNLFFLCLFKEFFSILNQKRKLKILLSTYEVGKRRSGTGFFPPTKWKIWVSTLFLNNFSNFLEFINHIFAGY